MATRLLADSDFFIAIYKFNDSNHESALHIFARIESENTSLALSIFSFAEIVTVLSQRVSHRTARNFMDDIEATGIQVVHAQDTIFERAKAVFRAQRSKNVSFTDAWNIALMQTKLFDALVSFDQDYQKNGIPLWTSQ